MVWALLQDLRIGQQKYTRKDLRKLLSTPTRNGEQTQLKHQALWKGKSPQSLPSRTANCGGVGEPESSKHFCAEITAFASLWSVIIRKRGRSFDHLTFSRYLVRFLRKSAGMPHFCAAFLLCIFFINTFWKGRLKSIFACNGIKSPQSGDPKPQLSAAVAVWRRRNSLSG